MKPPIGLPRPSWAASTVFCSRRETMNRRFGGPGLQVVGPVPSRGGSWVAPFRFFRMHWDDEPIVTNSCHTYNMNLFTYIAGGAGSWVEGTSKVWTRIEAMNQRKRRQAARTP